MSIVTMNMSSFEIERDNSVTGDDEVMLAHFNPALALQQQTAKRKLNSMPPDMVAVKAKAFLKRMTAYQQQHTT